MMPVQKATPVSAAVLVLTLAFTWAQHLAADSMRCGNKVVRSGDSPAKLLEYCGEPIYRGRGNADIQTRDGKRNVNVEYWHYKRGERSLENIVLIYRGKVVGMETGSR